MQHICDYWLASDGLGGEQVEAGALLEELTPDQSAVVLDDSAFIRVIAAAGSGKTKTLVAYVLRQMLEGIDPSEIVVFTFTEKAANELRARIYALAASLAPDPRRVPPCYNSAGRVDHPPALPLASLSSLVLSFYWRILAKFSASSVYSV